MPVLKYKSSNGEYKPLNNYLVQPITPVSGTGTSPTDVMSQKAVTDELSKKADTATTYTKTEVDTLVNNVDVSSQLQNYMPKTSAYTKVEVDNQVKNAKEYASGYTQTEINKLINSAPETLDTLGEIAAALQTSSDVKTAIDDAIVNKADKDKVISAITVGGTSITVTNGKAELEAYPTTLPASDVYEWAKAANKPSYTWTEINGKPDKFAPSAHTHTISDVTNLQTSLDGKAASSHTHTVSNITDFNSAVAAAISGKSDVGHIHKISGVTGLQDALDGKEPIATKEKVVIILEGTIPTHVNVNVNVNVNGSTKVISYDGSNTHYVVEVEKDSVYSVVPEAIPNYNTIGSITNRTAVAGETTYVTITYYNVQAESKIFSIIIENGLSSTSDSVTEGKNYGGTEMTNFFKKIRRCVITETDTFDDVIEGEVGKASIKWLNDADSSKYEDGTDAPITDHDVMVYFPEFWYKGEYLGSNKWEYKFSNENINGFHYSPAYLLGAYKAGGATQAKGNTAALGGVGSYSLYTGKVNGEDIYSRSGTYRITETSTTQFLEKAKNRGKGYQLIDYEMHKNIALLFFLKYKDTNSQAKCGACSNVIGIISGASTATTDGQTINGVLIGESSHLNVNNYPFFNGCTNHLGMRDSTPSDGGAVYNRWSPNDDVNLNGAQHLNNFLGLEGAWNYVYEAVDKESLIINNGNWNISIPTKYTKGTTKRYVQAYWTDANEGSTREGYIKTLALDTYGDIIPTSVGGSNSGYFADYYYFHPEYGNSQARVLFRSYSCANSNGGVSYAYTNYGASTASFNVGSRLAFRGKIWDADNEIYLN